ncbi:Glycine cleavage system H protein [Plasmodiophora brassicae]
MATMLTQRVRFAMRAMTASRAWASTKLFTESHEWVDNDNRVGISDFAQSELGDIVYIDLPDVGAKFKKGAVFGSVESVKAASDVYMPVSGEVVEVNDDAKSNPAIVNEDAEGKGWMLKIKADDDAEREKLLNADAYKSHVEK